MTVAVTGARGYLGGWVVEFLRTRTRWNVMELPGRTSDGWLSCASVADAVIHLAWYSSAGDKYAILHRECLERTRHLLDIVRQRDIPFVFASTASVYGEHDGDPKSERDSANPNCEYSRMKLRAETLVKGALDGRGVILRFGSLMGVGKTRTKTDIVVNAFAQDAYWDQQVTCWGPNDYKPVIHVRDAAKIVFAAMNPKIGMCGTYNVALSCPRAADIAETVHLQTGAGIRYVERPDGAIRRSCRVDCTKLHNALRGIRYREISDAIREFDGRIPLPEDRNEPWV